MALDTFINGERKQTAKKRGETVRLELELAPPTEETTRNEWSYVQLVDDASKKDQDPQKALDPFDEDSDANLIAIARQFEEKYGPKKRKRIINQSDLIDRGHGYDKNDSFVDDSEVYEDFVPVHVDTQLGGFYVNTGGLGFKQAEDIDEEELEFAFKKRKLPKLKKQPSHTTPQAILASQKLKKAKQHVASQKAPKGTKSLQRALFSTTATSSSTASTMTGASVLVKPTSKAKSTTAEITKKPKKVTIKSLPGAEINAPSLSGVLKSSSPSVPIGIGGISVPIFELSRKLNGADTTVSTVGASGSGAAGDSVLSSTELSVAPETVKPPPVLPDNLPPTITTKIYQLEEAITRDQGADGKVSNKMRASYDPQLVDIELACKAVTIKTRAAILEYLAFKLDISRSTLVKRIKQKLRKREDDALEEPLHKLKEAINASMPEQIAHYEEEVKAKTESLSSQITGPEKMEVDEDSKMEDVFEDSQLPSSSQQETTGKTVKQVKTRKKYKWTEETKKLVCQVVRVKVESEESINRITRGNGEEIITQFLEDKVKPLWPKGWMQRSVLYKVSDSVHKHFTNPEKQPRKATVKKEKDKPLAIKKEDPIDTKPVTRPSTSVPVSLLVPVASPITKIQNPLAAKGGPVTIPKVVQTTIATRTIQSAPSTKGAGGGALYQPGSVSKTVQFGAATVVGGKTAGGITAGSLHTITPASTQQAAGQFKQSNLKGTTVGTMLAGASRASEKTRLMKPETKPSGGTAATPLSSTLLSQQMLSAVLVPHLQLSTSANTGSLTTSTSASIQAALAKLSQSALAPVKQSTCESSAPGTTVKTKPVVQLTKVSAASQVPPPSSSSSVVKASTGRHSQVVIVSNTQTSPRPAPSSYQTATTQAHSPLRQYSPVTLSVGVQSPPSTKPSPSQVVASSQSVIMAGRPSSALATGPLSSPAVFAPTSSLSSQSTPKPVKSPMEQILNEHSYDSHHQFIFVPTGVNPVIHTATGADKTSSQSLLMLGAQTSLPSCTTSYGTAAPPIITSSTGSQQTATYTTCLNINTLPNLKMPESP